MKVSKNKKVAIGIALSLLYLSMAFATLNDAGIVWDETRHLAGAKARAYSIYAAFTGKPQLEMCRIDTELPKDSDDYGRCWDGRPRLSQTLSGLSWAVAFYTAGGNLDFFQSLAAHRLPTILLTAACLFVVFLMASEMFDIRTGILSGIALVFIPRFFADSHYATLDIPVACMMVFASYLFWKGRKDWRLGVAAGIMSGLAMATKNNADFLPAFLLFWLAAVNTGKICTFLKTAARYPQKTIGKLSAWGSAKKHSSVLSIVLLPLPVMVLAWPWLWNNTIARFLVYEIPNINNVRDFGFPVLYMDTYGRAPWHYSVVMTALTIPVPILIFGTVGAALASWFIIRKKGGWENHLLVLILAIAPILVFATPLATPYNIVRLFQNSFPFIAILAGLGASSVVGVISARIKIPSAKTIVSILVAVTIIIPGALSICSGNNNSATYYNEIIGGHAGAFASGNQVEYFGEAILEAVYWLNENAKPNTVVHSHQEYNFLKTYKYGDIGIISELAVNRNEFGSALSGFSINQKGLLRDDIQITTAMGNEILKNSDYFIFTMILNDFTQFDGDERRTYLENCVPLHTVRAGGAPLVQIYDSKCVNITG